MAQLISFFSAIGQDGATDPWPIPISRVGRINLSSSFTFDTSNCSFHRFGSHLLSLTLVIALSSICVSSFTFDTSNCFFHRFASHLLRLTLVIELFISLLPTTSLRACRPRASSLSSARYRRWSYEWISNVLKGQNGTFTFKGLWPPSASPDWCKTKLATRQ